MLANEPEHAWRMIETWIAYQVPLLRRLSVHGVTESATLSADQKIEWVMQKDLLYASG
jgi:cell wall assembly regulator SMI1